MISKIKAAIARALNKFVERFVSNAIIKTIAIIEARKTEGGIPVMIRKNINPVIVKNDLI